MILAATPGTATLLVELGAILIALALLGRLAARFGIPSIPLYLVAGLAVGEGGIVELVTAREFIESGAQIGVILLLLLLGLEYTGGELTSALREHAPAGAVDLALNFTPGLLLGLLFGWDFRERFSSAASPTSRHRGSSPRSSPISATRATARPRSCSPSSSPRTWSWRSISRSWPGY